MQNFKYKPIVKEAKKLRGKILVPVLLINKSPHFFIFNLKDVAEDIKITKLTKPITVLINIRDFPEPSL
jgi:hypothetical protein